MTLLLTSNTDGHHRIVILGCFKISPASADLDLLLTVMDDVAVFTYRLHVNTNFQ